MNEFIDSLKIKLIEAVDLNQKKITKITDIKEALRDLESFPMTLDILNSSRIGKIVNDIRHFNDAQSDIKTRLKDLIKQWNDQLLPHHNKKPNKIPKPSNSNGCNKSISKVSETSNNNISHYNNENYKEKHLLSLTKPRSSNNLEIMNGKIVKNLKDDCDNSFEIPNKKQRLDNKTIYSESPKTLLKEIHLDVESCPPIYKSNNFDNNFSQKHDSPASLHFTDVKRFIKKEEDHHQHHNVSPITKHRKRKHDLSFNGVTATPLQKVKSTRELLADISDLVGSDTKKKILCNEIAFEDDIPKSCIPESVRPKPKQIKQLQQQQQHTKSGAQNIDSLIGKPMRYSPKSQPSQNDDDFHRQLSDIIPEQQSKSDRSKEPHQKLSHNNSHSKYHPSPFGNGNNSHSNTKRSSSSPNSDQTNHAQSVATPTLSDDLDKCSLKIKIPLKPYSKKKSKHHDPPVTNRMDDLPTLPVLVLPDLPPQSVLNPDSLVDHSNHVNISSITDNDSTSIAEVAELLAHMHWEGYNCTRHPISGNLFGFNDLYKVDHLCVLAWTDRVYECPSFFPSDSVGELGWLESTICEFS